MRFPTMRREACPTCQQPIVPPTPSKVILVRVGMAAFAVASGVLEYRRAVRRELEQAKLEQLHDTSLDVPLDEHLDQREPGGPFMRKVDLYENGEHTGHWDDGQQVDDADLVREFAAEGVTATPWPPSHPSLADEHDAPAAEQ